MRFLRSHLPPGHGPCDTVQTCSLRIQNLACAFVTPGLPGTGVTGRVPLFCTSSRQQRQARDTMSSIMANSHTCTCKLVNLLCAGRGSELMKILLPRPKGQVAPFPTCPGTCQLPKRKHAPPCGLLWQARALLSRITDSCGNREQFCLDSPNNRIGQRQNTLQTTSSFTALDIVYGMPARLSHGLRVHVCGMTRW